MDTLKIQRNSSSIDWKPSPIVALATSTDESRVAAAREDGSLEIWLVSPGSVTWHCQLTIQADSNSRISSLVWCPSGSKKGPSERLLSSSIDGSISEWDLFDLKQKTVLDSVGVSIWQMAVEPIEDVEASLCKVNGSANVKSLARDDDDDETSEIDDDVDAVVHLKPTHENRRVAVGCDDGCVRLYAVPASDELIYNRSFPRVSGRVLSVVWSLDSKLIFSGSSDGFIRCWDAKLAHEMYRITVGHGGFGSGPELCIWSLLFLRSGTVVSGDGSGSVQFWDSLHGTLLQTHSCHKGDVNALAAAPSHNRVFSAGSDGQVVLYKLSSDAAVSGIIKSSNGIIRKWVYVGYVRAHTHDVRTLTVAVPISTAPLPNEKVKKARCRKKPTNSSYYKWAYPGSPMLISAGDDTKLFSYSVKEFTKFSPHDICPAPQRVPMQMVLNPTFSGASLVMVQCSSSLDILRVTKKAFGADKSTQLVTRIKSKAARKIICSTISSSGTFFAYSDHVTPSLFQLKISGEGKSTLAVPEKRPLLRKLPYARSMVFSTDSSRLMIAGEDKKIYVVDVNSAGLLHTFRPRRKVDDDSLPAMEPPITKMFTSSDGQWLAAINCFGDIYVFNLEIQRQHWFISRLDGACVTAGGFSPSENNILIITTSSNQVYALDLEAKQLGEWSMHQTCVLPRRFQELPGEVIGLSFPPSCSTSVTIYSSRAMCSIDYGKPVPQDDDSDLANSIDLTLKKLQNSSNIKVLKRKRKDALQTNLKQKFDVTEFRDPVLFVGHLSEDSVLVMDKPWREVVQTFEAPVHRHIFGT